MKRRKRTAEFTLTAVTLYLSLLPVIKLKILFHKILSRDQHVPYMAYGHKLNGNIQYTVPF